MSQQLLKRPRTEGWISAVFTLGLALVAQAQDNGPLKLERTITLPGVSGRIDHMAVDAEGKRLFVAALGNNTIEVADLVSGERIHTITGLKEPQGVVYLDEFKRLFTANGADGSCMVFAEGSWTLADTLSFSGDADNIRNDPKEQRVYVGYGGGGLGIIDATNVRRMGDVQLSGHPESFELERSGQRIFVNVPTSSQVEVVDRKQGTVIAKWSLGEVKENFPMALDESTHRLFIGCRSPAKVLIYDTESGKEAGGLEIAGDVDDLFFDAGAKRLYASCGEGFVHVFQQKDPDHYLSLVKLATAKGARTSFLDPQRKRLFLAVPRQGGKEAEIQVYTVQP